MRLGGHRHDCSGFLALLFYLALIGCFKLIRRFEVGYNPLDFLGEGEVVRCFGDGSGVYLYGVREGVLKVTNLRSAWLAVSARAE